MAACDVDGIELPPGYVFKCDCGCGQSMCLSHLNAHHKEVKMTQVTVPKLMGVRK